MGGSRLTRLYTLPPFPVIYCPPPPVIYSPLTFYTSPPVIYSPSLPRSYTPLSPCHILPHPPPVIHFYFSLPHPLIIYSPPPPQSHVIYSYFSIHFNSPLPLSLSYISPSLYNPGPCHIHSPLHHILLFYRYFLMQYCTALYCTVLYIIKSGCEKSYQNLIWFPKALIIGSFLNCINV